MDQKLSCELVKDLLPNYIENMTSAETNKIIEEHLMTCSQCREALQEMKQELPLEVAPEVKDFKKYIRQTRFQYGIAALFGLSVLAVMVCLIVNIAVDRTLSWSWIAAGGILYTDITVYTLIKAKKNKLLKGLFAASVLVIPYLALIYEVTSRFYVTTSYNWFWRLAFPLALYWVIGIWLMVLIWRVFKPNLFYLFSILMFYSVPGGLLVKFLTTGNLFADGFHLDTFVNITGNMAAAVILLVFGILYEIKKKRS